VLKPRTKKENENMKKNILLLAMAAALGVAITFTAEAAKPSSDTAGPSLEEGYCTQWGGKPGCNFADDTPCGNCTWFDSFTECVDVVSTWSRDALECRRSLLDDGYNVSDTCNATSLGLDTPLGLFCPAL
jgi:hypothetical protein